MDYKVVLLLLIVLSNISFASAQVFLDFVSAPETVTTGQEFSIVVNLSVDLPTELKLYSYVYNASTCYSFFGWTANSVNITLLPNEFKVVELKDLIKHDALSGNYTLKVRARTEKDYDITRSLAVIQSSPNLNLNVQKKSGSDPIRNYLLILSIIPLVILVLIRFVNK